MKNGFEKSEHRFLPMVWRTFVIMLALLIIGAIFIDAPLGNPATPKQVPNPSKSAWFLLWMQELVSYSNYFIYLIIGLFTGILFLPKMVKTKTDQAKWFPQTYRWANWTVVIILVIILVLTVIAYFFRGAYWELMI